MNEKLNLFKNEPQINLSTLEHQIQNSKNIGNKRVVKKIKTPQGTFFLKEIQSADEVSSIVNLHNTGISEKPIDIDEKNLLVEETIGTPLDSFRYQMDAHNPEKTNSHVLELVNIDMITKGFYQNLIGIAHQDIKIDNVIINKNNEVIFIDYGESQDILSQRNGQKWSHNKDQLKILENVSAFIPEAKIRYDQPQKELTLSTYQTPEVVEAIFDHYKVNNVSFEKRPQILKKIFDRYPNEVLSALNDYGIPKKSQQSVFEKIQELNDTLITEE